MSAGATRGRRLDEVDAGLVERAAQGDAGALREVVLALRAPAHVLALRITGHHDDANDASQEAILRVITRLSSFAGESSFSTWAWTVMTRAVIDYVGRQRRGPSLSFGEFEADLERGVGAFDVPEPERRVLLWQVKIGCARAMLQCLGLDARVAYVLGEILELDAPTCARILGISAPAFRKRLSRARSVLYASLHRMCGVASPERAACTCEGRAQTAMSLGRLDGRDEPEAGARVDALREYVAGLQQLERPAAFFRADPRDTAPEELLERVMDACMGP